jgi:acetoin:2,6-dichlorophenolindophenol oxidoreductase subunit beta
MTNFSDGIRDGFNYVLANHQDVIALGQGLWSPWYVGQSMTDLDKQFGRDRVLDTPVSEQSTTGMAIGLALGGYRPIVIHPRLDFMVLASDSIVNQAAKWRHMLGGTSNVPMTIRGIINRGGEQGAQHSQALQSWYAHIPGLRVVMPATAKDARDLLIASVLCDDPVLYIDDRWLYEVEGDLGDVDLTPLAQQGPVVRRTGTDITLAAASYSFEQGRQAAEILEKDGISVELVDIRVLNPFDPSCVIESVSKTGRLLAVDGGWTNCGFAGEIIASACESVSPADFKQTPARITLTDTPAPTSSALEKIYYTSVEEIVAMVRSMVKGP